MKKLTLRLKPKNKAQIRVNAWGVLAYTFSIFSYVLLGIVLFRYLQDSSILRYPMATPDSSSTGAAMSSSPDMLATYFGYGVTAVIIVLAVAMFVSFPYILSRYYARGLRHILKMFPAGVSLRSLFYAKAIAGVVPLGGFMAIALADQYFDSVFAYCYVGCVFSVILAELAFYVQFRIVRRTKIALKYIW